MNQSGRRSDPAAFIFCPAEVACAVMRGLSASTRVAHGEVVRADVRDLVGAP